MPSPKIDEVIAKFTELREKRAALKREYEAQDFILKQGQEKIEAYLMRYLDSQNTESVKTKEGTAYFSTETKVSCADWPGLYQWVLANARPDIFEKRLTTKVVTEYEEETGALPPYVNKMVEKVVRVRRT
jgi:hypothetical protein